MNIRPAKIDDVPQIVNVFDQARAYQWSTGNRQWREGYPCADDVLNDISHYHALVVEHDGSIVAYFVIVPNDEAYLGVVPVSQKFCVVHRMAVSDSVRGQGLTRQIFDAVKRWASSNQVGTIFVDTGADNAAMQHIVSSNGFVPLGNYDFVWGPRLVYAYSL